MKHYTSINNATDFNHDMRKFRVDLCLICIVTKQELQSCCPIPEVEHNLQVLHHHPVHYC